MYRILQANVMLRLDGRWHSTTAVLTNVSGGMQVNYVANDGTILKSQAYSRSTYSRKNGDGFDDADKTVQTSLSDPDFFNKMKVLDLHTT